MSACSWLLGFDDRPLSLTVLEPERQYEPCVVSRLASPRLCLWNSCPFTRRHQVRYLSVWNTDWFMKWQQQKSQNNQWWCHAMGKHASHLSKIKEKSCLLKSFYYLSVRCCILNWKKLLWISSTSNCVLSSTCRQNELFTVTLFSMDDEPNNSTGWASSRIIQFKEQLKYLMGVRS